MDIHEYQAKKILSNFGIPIPKGALALSEENAVQHASLLESCPFWVIKAQIHAGGRRNSGGIQFAHSLEEVKTHAQNLLGKMLITPQTGPLGKKVNALYIEEGIPIKHEFYMSLFLDRSPGQISMTLSSKGGVNIEETLEDSPQDLHSINIDPLLGFTSFYAGQLLAPLLLEKNLLHQFETLLQKLYHVYTSLDATILEINPLAVTESGELCVLDVKMSFDENALFRHPEIRSLRDLREEEPLEAEASNHTLNYIKLDGNIGCLVNGAGLAMATLDLLNLKGGKAANFLDIGGSASQEKILKAFQIILSDTSVRGILVNIFGGIIQCDTVARGLIQAFKDQKKFLPLVVRLVGNKENEARQILEKSALPIHSVTSLEEATQMIIKAVGS
ncbi:MAG TPA: ADP-forming succinate--CoA ligase subunit beta [Alphaproteobacteria bacterium]|nr:MAG: succinate--CoA ligase subunit beta [Alphaproteobacteria bacterium 17-39-52]HQS84986.1 ADP-forming succinate--CoA ligase subunit beta [Alphaproteobacteria bacterium]HQS94730.1 ADP-forming succinate--CoA ligase subunit beta [Alphaproteobacteria bacterium]